MLWKKGYGDFYVVANVVGSWWVCCWMGVVRMFCVMLVATLPHAPLPLKSASVYIYIHTHHRTGTVLP